MTEKDIWKKWLKIHPEDENLTDQQIESVQRTLMYHFFSLNCILDRECSLASKRFINFFQKKR